MTSNRIAEGCMSCYHIPLELAHIIVTQACLSTLLQLDDHMTRAHLKDFCLAEYAALYWVDHAKFENVSSHVEDAMKLLFDPRNSHLSAWNWIYGIDRLYHLDRLHRRPYMVSDTPFPPDATPLYYAALCDLDGVVEWLVKTCSQDVNAHGGRYGTPLVAASSRGCLKVVHVLLKHNAHVYSPSHGDWTSLHAASSNVRLEVCRVLLDSGANVDAIDGEGRTSLHVALQNYNWTLNINWEARFEVAKLLLEHGADPNSRDKDEKTPLYAALEFYRPEFAPLLLKHGADINTQNDAGQSQLHIASRDSDLKVVRQLVELGANIHVQDNQGRTPFHVALEVGHPGIVQLLLEHGADPYAADGNGATPLYLASHYEYLLNVVERLLELGANIHARDHECRTPLHGASTVGAIKVAQLLIERGADPNAQDGHGATPLHAGVVSQWRGFQTGVFENMEVGKIGGQIPTVSAPEVITQLLLEHGAGPNARNDDGATPLHVASRAGRLKVVERLLELGANLHARDNEGRTPLHAASGMGKVAVAQLLIEHGADPNVQDGQGSTPLHVGVVSRRKDLRVMLWEQVSFKDGDARSLGGQTPQTSSRVWSEDGADPNDWDNDYSTRGQTLPQMPSRIGSEEEQLLPEYGADSNDRDNDYVTPLLLPAVLRRRALEIVERLLELGANVHVRDSQGWTPFQVASEEGEDGTAQLLLNHGAERT